MKAIVSKKYGSPDVLEYIDVPKPVPKDNEVLIKIHAASLNARDWHILAADPFMMRLFFGLFTPKNKIPGSDIAGVVEEVGKDVTQFKPGDKVYGDMSECGDGAFAEYVVKLRSIC